MSDHINKPFLQTITDPVFESRNVQVQMLRLDIIDPGISGNKWYKLKYNFEEALRSGKSTVLTFGGAYSNHIHATAIASAKAGLKSIGVIRGERIDPLNPTLDDADKQGMEFHFVSRSEYRNKSEDSFTEMLKLKFGDFYLIPEGGTNKLAIKGASDILKELPGEFDYLIIPVGTGGTISGIIAGLEGKGIAIGMVTLKGNFLNDVVADLVFDYNGAHFENWKIIDNYHFGGYAKFTIELVEFINHFKKTQGVALDPVYTGKMMYGLYDLVKKDYFKPGSKIIAIHTGGLQGIRGFNERFGNLIP